MRRYCFIAAIASLLLLFFSFGASAATPTPASTSTTVKAMVGKDYLSVSGFASPFASIVMSTNSIFMASTVADQNGNFSMKDILINEGFSKFCLETIDFKRIGDSFTCIEIPPAKENAVRKNILLPPTLGLTGRSIRLGSSIFAQGFTMPGAKVRVKIGSGLYIETKANQDGFYKSEVKSLPVGTYFLIASANYHQEDSTPPLRSKELLSISTGEIVKKNFPLLLIIILIVITTIILVIILLRFYKKRTKKEISHLHHFWFLGF